MKRRQVARRGLLATVLALTLAACAALPGAGRHADLRFLVPNAPGGGYDTTARIAAQALEEEGITDRIEIFNVDGASGVVGLARTINERGNEDLLMMMGLGVVGAVYTNDTDADLGQVTPIARMLSEPEIIAVPSTSRFHTLDDLLTAWRRHPRALAVGGGSSPGGPDFLAPHLLAKAVGIDPRAVDYQQYDGGGPLLAALLDGEVDFAVSGVGEYADQIRNGPLRVLAVTGERPVPGLPAPTLQQRGVDLAFVNWRGFVAPPGLSKAERASLTRMLVALHDSRSWHRAAEANGWDDTFLTGAALDRFLRAESTRVAEVMRELGFAS
jgi:putative tricarboxylic transport membrane protein